MMNNSEVCPCEICYQCSELNIEEKCKAKRKVQIQPRNLPYYHNYHLFKSKFSSYDAPLVALLSLLCENCDIC